MRFTHVHGDRHRYRDEARATSGAQGEPSDFSGVRFKGCGDIGPGVVEGLVQRKLRAKVVELLRLAKTAATRNKWRLSGRIW